MVVTTLPFSPAEDAPSKSSSVGDGEKKFRAPAGIGDAIKASKVLIVSKIFDDGTKLRSKMADNWMKSLFSPGEMAPWMEPLFSPGEMVPFEMAPWVKPLFSPGEMAPLNFKSPDDWLKSEKTFAKRMKFRSKNVDDWVESFDS